MAVTAFFYGNAFVSAFNKASNKDYWHVYGMTGSPGVASPDKYTTPGKAAAKRMVSVKNIRRTGKVTKTTRKTSKRTSKRSPKKNLRRANQQVQQTTARKQAQRPTTTSSRRKQVRKQARQKAPKRARTRGR